jgi:glycosyltransferase involved in cell wall biosynthesis
MKMNDEQPLVSVLMTAYNREKYIAEAIESVLASTYTNFELIVVDDCSKDRTVEIAKCYELKDNRINVYTNEKNLGDYPNRNKAAGYAKGKFLKYIDADDLIYPFGLEQLVYYMSQFPGAGYGLCSLEQDEKHVFPFQLQQYEAYHRHYFEQPLFHKAPLSAIIRKEAFDDVGGFSGQRMLGDFDMWHRLSQKYAVVLMPHGIVWYRVHEEQEITLYKTDPLEPFKYYSNALKHLENKLCPLSANESQIAINQIKYNISRSVISAARHHGLKKALELKRESGKSLNEIIHNLLFMNK